MAYLKKMYNESGKSVMCELAMIPQMKKTGYIYETCPEGIEQEVVEVVETIKTVEAVAEESTKAPTKPRKPRTKKIEDVKMEVEPDIVL